LLFLVRKYTIWQPLYRICVHSRYWKSFVVSKLDLFGFKRNGAAFTNVAEMHCDQI
jgi:hypothetical protein